jgi:RND family efflux transporter MFP subunit
LLLTATAAGAEDPAPRGPAAGPDLRAQLSPRRFTTLSSELAAKIEKIAVREGERFTQGQTLVALDCAIQRAQLERAHSVAASAEKIHATNQRLSELNSVSSLEIEAANMEEARAKGDLQVITATVSKCTITAPFNGRVTEQKAREQQFLQAGQPVLDILDDSTLEIEFIVSSRWLAWLKPGQGFTIQIDETGKSYPAKVTRLGAKVDAVSQSVKVIGEITGGFPELMAGMSGKVLLAPPPP